MAGGRPTLYKPEHCETLVELMKMGRSITSVACILDVHVDTVYEWAKVHPEFSEALKKGVQFSENWWLAEAEKSLRDRDFNSTLWYMNMKNRFGWRDKTENNNNTTISFEDGLKELK